MATFTLSGTGIQAISSPGSLAIVVTIGSDSAQVGAANPPNLYHLGLLRVGTARGYLPAVPVDAVNMLLPCPNGATQLGYALKSGVTITAEERAEQPYAGPTGPPGATGATGATGAAGSAGSTLIADVTLASDASNIDISSIPATFTHLWLHYRLRGAASASSTGAVIRFNNDSGAHYDYNNIFRRATTVSGTQATAAAQWEFAAVVPAATSLFADDWAQGEMRIPFYRSNGFKTAHYEGYSPATTSLVLQYWQAGGCQWQQTAVIDRVTVMPPSNNWKAGSRLTLWGW